jgi:hypothetical protein
MPNPKGKALIKAFLALPKETFAGAAPPTTAKDWEDAELFIPLSRPPAAKKTQPQKKIASKRQARSEPVKRKTKRA